MQTLVEGTRTVLRLDDGQDLFAALSDHAHREKVHAAVIVSIIGMLKQSAIGYWNGKEYSTKELTTPHELVGAHGSIADVDGEPSVHLHVTLAGADHTLVGGHLMRGTVGILGEAYLETFPNHRFSRILDESLGLRKLDLGTR